MTNFFLLIYEVLRIHWKSLIRKNVLLLELNPQVFVSLGQFFLTHLIPFLFHFLLSFFFDLSFAVFPLIIEFSGTLTSVSHDIGVFFEEIRESL